MIYISFKNLLKTEWPVTVKVIFYDVIGCSIGVCDLNLLSNNIKIFYIQYIPNIPR